MLVYIIFFFFFQGVTYPIVSHWVWSPEGWLMKIGFSDFSGAGPVHLLAGTCSFVAALFIGPRMGRFNSACENEFSGHSMPVRLGVMIIFIIIMIMGDNFAKYITFQFYLII